MNIFLINHIFLIHMSFFYAGVNVAETRNHRLGVFIGSCFSEAEKASFYVAQTKTGFGIMG